MMTRYLGAVATFLASLLIGSGIGLADPQLPARTGAVVDAANIIGTNQEQTLADKVAKLQSQSGVELVVVTLPGLQGYSIERWGRDLGNRWQVGGSAARGVVLIVAPNDRQVRIEVGDGLPLPDSAAASIVSNIIVPQFRSGEMSGGILAGVDAVARAVEGSPSGSDWQWPSFRGVSWSNVGIWVIVGVLILLVVLKVMQDGWHLPTDYDKPTRDTWSTGSANDDDGYFFGSGNSSWSSSDSSWSSSSSSDSSSGGFSGSGASGRW